MKRRWLYILIALAIALFMARQVRTRGGVPAELEARAQAYDVEIIRDRWGVPHIIGKTDADAAYGLAYAHAEDDFSTIQGSLLAARGRLATVFGSEGASNDFMVALLKTTQFAESGYAALDSTTRALCDGYADGLNVYAARNPDDAIGSLFPVTGTDIVAGFVHKTPLFVGVDRVLRELFEQESGADESDRTPQATGSNAFAVSPRRSETGNTMLAVNSHQPWTGPVAWYEAHMMSSEGLNVLGGTFPGSPVILHGHNEYLGWAHTVNAPDLVDTYALTVNPDDDQQYLLDGIWTEFERTDISIPVRLVGLLEWNFEREVLWSAHGPAVRTDSGVVAVRFAGWGDARQVAQWYRMDRATNLAEWYEAMSMQALPVFNTVYADAKGHIGYIYNARLPIRPEGYDWRGRLPGDRSDLIWTEYLPFTELPQVLDPPVGFVQNANSTPFGTTGTESDPVAESVSETFGIETLHTNRSMRALRLFGADSSITWQEFAEYKYDMKFDPDSRAARMVRQLKFATPGDSLTQAAVAVLSDWDLGTEPTNREAALAMVSLQSHLSDPRPVPTAQLLAETRGAAEWLLEQYGTLRPQWREVNRLRRGTLDVGLGGGPDVLHAIYSRKSGDGHLVGYQGDSYVLLVSFDPGGRVRSESVHVYGAATSRPESDHYADQSPLFARRMLKPMPFYEADVRMAADRSYRPGR
jgi:acyl-homoserine-lactone acylase